MNVGCPLNRRKRSSRCIRNIGVPLILNIVQEGIRFPQGAVRRPTSQTGRSARLRGWRSSEGVPVVELLLARTMDFLPMPALGRRPAGVPWVHMGHRNSSQSCLVSKEATRLGESPTAKPVPRITATSRDPFPKFGQVFHADGSARGEDRGLGGESKPLADLVMEILPGGNLVRRFAGEKFTGDPVDGGVQPLRHGQQDLGLLGIGHELDLLDQPHTCIGDESDLPVNTTAGRTRAEFLRLSMDQCLGGRGSKQREERNQGDWKSTAGGIDSDQRPDPVGSGTRDGNLEGSQPWRSV